MCNVVIPVSYSHLNQIIKGIPFIKRYIDCHKIVIIAKDKLACYFNDYSDIEFIDENNLGIGEINSIATLIKNRGGDGKRAGWYFQQFLKMAYANYCDDEYYILWDADTIPMRHIDFIKDGKMLFNMKKEHHKPYFKTIDKIFNGKIIYDNIFPNSPSFITEGMIVNKNLMKEMIERINKNENLKGKTWVEKIMYSIDKRDLNYSGFSEYETYGYYLSTYYPNCISIRLLETCRNGTEKYGNIEYVDIESIKDYDTVTFEIWNRNLFHKVIFKIKYLISRI